MQRCRVNRVRVLHADAVVRAGVVSMLDGYEDIAITAGDGTVEASSPGDIVIADHLTALALAGSSPAGRRPRILVLTNLDREWNVRMAMEAGVNGYVLQRCRPDELVDAVRTVAMGLKYLSAELAPKLADGLMHDALTSRELEVLQAMSTGASNKAISHALGIADGTVKAHVRAILNKVGAAARTEAVAIAARRGLTSP